MSDFAYTQTSNAEDWARGFVPGQSLLERAARAKLNSKICAPSAPPRCSPFANSEQARRERCQTGAEA